MRILLNHVGYDANAPKRAVLQVSGGELQAGLGLQGPLGGPRSVAAPRGGGWRAPATPPGQPALRCRVLHAATAASAWEGQASFAGPVERWKDWLFWTLDFSDLRQDGRYALVVPASPAGPEVRSQPFEIGQRLLLRRTAPAVLQYFRSQRCAGELDEADRRMSFHGGRGGRVDVHGGWYDASGDSGKYLSHLSYTNFMNPQQAPLVVWSFLAARDLLRGGPGFPLRPGSRQRQGKTPGRPTRRGQSGAPEGLMRGLRRGLFAEALYGADFLLRMQDPAGYFYISVFDGWSRDPSRREICAFRRQAGIRSDRYQAGFRQGGGLAIAALARAAAEAAGLADRELADRARVYREAAERGFAHLAEHNFRYLDDGRENIIDDYCALLAATELYRTGGRQEHLDAAQRRAARLAARLCEDGRHRHWWRAGDTPERPFYHAAEAGLPAIALLRYAATEPEADPAWQALEAAINSLRFEVALTAEVANPFGYARQYVKPLHGEKRSSFFMPHENESGYWWQGENARLASLAAAARLVAGGGAGPDLGADLRLNLRPDLGADSQMVARLQRYAASQLDWILGLNPFDACLLHGLGRNNPEYEASHPNAFGGICNGITGGIEDELDVDFLPEPYAARGEHRWRWSEQWIPHGAWYLLAICAGPTPGRASSAR